MSESVYSHGSTAHLGEFVRLQHPTVFFDGVSLHELAPGHIAHAVLHGQFSACPTDPGETQYCTVADTPGGQIWGR